MRFSGAEPPTTTPCAFDSTGIIKTVKEKPNVPSARRIMEASTYFDCRMNKFAKHLDQRNSSAKRRYYFYEKDILKRPLGMSALGHKQTSRCLIQLRRPSTLPVAP